MTRTVKFDGRPIWAEVSLGALTHNLRAIAPRQSRGRSRPAPENSRRHQEQRLRPRHRSRRARALQGPRRLVRRDLLRGRRRTARERHSRTGPDPHRLLGGRGKANSRQPPDAGDHERRPVAATGKGGRATAQAAQAPLRFSSQDRHRHESPGHSAVGNSGVRARAGGLPARAPGRHVHAHRFVGSFHDRTNHRAGKNI